jgi:hypothetical protein
MRQPDEIAMKHLALLLDRQIVPVDRARFEAQHAGNCANQAGLTAAIAALQNQ